MLRHSNAPLVFMEWIGRQYDMERTRGSCQWPRKGSFTDKKLLAPSDLS